MLWPKKINTKKMLTKKIHASFLLVCPELTFFLTPRNNIIFIRVISLAYCVNWTMGDYFRWQTYFIEQWKHFLANWDYLIVWRQYMHFIRYNLGQKELRFCTFVSTERLSRGFGTAMALPLAPGSEMIQPGFNIVFFRGEGRLSTCSFQCFQALS